MPRRLARGGTKKVKAVRWEEGSLWTCNHRKGAPGAMAGTIQPDGAQPWSLRGSYPHISYTDFPGSLEGTQCLQLPSHSGDGYGRDCPEEQGRHGKVAGTLQTKPV